MKKVKSFVIAAAVLMMPCAVFAQDRMTTVDTSSSSSTETVGTVSELRPDTIVVRSETNAAPTNYTYTKKTTYVDENGAPVSVETVKSGLPVTVYSTREGDRLVADKVVVRKTTTTTTENPAMPMQEKRTRTSTTTETKY